MIVKLDNDFSTVWYCPELKALIIRWKAFTNSQQFRKVMRFALDLIEREDVKHWIGDTTNAKVLLPKEYELILENFVPEVITHLSSVSAIRSKNIFRQLELERFIESAASRGIKINLFQTMDEAKYWIKNHAPEEPLIESIKNKV